MLTSHQGAQANAEQKTASGSLKPKMTGLPYFTYAATKKGRKGSKITYSSRNRRQKRYIRTATHY